MQEKVEELLEKIRPALVRDGGNVELVEVADGTVKVKLTGACAGCPMSTMTLKNGIDILANAVVTTMGPKGRNVALDKKWGAPTITHDGVTVAKEIELEDRFENIGAQMIKEVASKTSDVAGDGTTTATVLAQAIYREGFKMVAAGTDSMELKRGVDKAVEVTVEELQKISKPTRDQKEIAQVGTISANNDATIGNIIAEAMSKVGKEGVITVEEAKSMETTLEIVGHAV